jgi:hypothetical protein
MVASVMRQRRLMVGLCIRIVFDALNTDTYANRCAAGNFRSLKLTPM